VFGTIFVMPKIKTMIPIIKTTIALYRSIFTSFCLEWIELVLTYG
jgi:hypothetical protein